MPRLLDGAQCRAALGFACAIVAAGIVSTSACSDAIGPLQANEGELSLSYTGIESGVFSARGARPLDWETATHAAGLRHSSGMHVFAQTVKGSGVADFFFWNTVMTQPGTYPFSGESGVEQRAYAELALDVSNATGFARAIYVLVSGEITIEPSTDGRIRGRFEGTGRLLNGSAMIAITDGWFDVPNVLEPPIE